MKKSLVLLFNLFIITIVINNQVCAQLNKSTKISGNIKKMQGNWQYLEYDREKDSVIPTQWIMKIQGYNCYESEDSSTIILLNHYIDIDSLVANNKNVLNAISKDMDNDNGVWWVTIDTNNYDYMCREIDFVGEDTLEIYNPKGSHGGVSKYKRVKEDSEVMRKTKFTKCYNQQNLQSKVDFVANPDSILTDMQYCVLAAMWEWSDKNMNKLADQNDVDAVSKKINGGTNGLSERRDIYSKAKQIFNIK